MPRYTYTRIYAAAYQQRYFQIKEMRAAVEYLRTLPGADTAQLVGLGAETSTGGHWPDGTIMFKLLAKPFVRLPWIIGKTPVQVWAEFDRQVDEDRKGLVRRFNGHQASYMEYLGID